MSLPLPIARKVQEAAGETEMGQSEWIRRLIERSFGDSPPDSKTKALLREIRAWLKPPRGASPATKAGLKATSLIVEERVRASRGCPAPLEWQRLFTMAEQARKQAGEAEPGVEPEPAQPRKPTYEELIEQKEREERARWVIRQPDAQPGSQKDLPEGEVDESDSAIIEPAISEPILSTEERTALEARLAEVEAILDRLGPQVEAPRSILLDTFNLSGQQLERARQAFYEGPVYQTWLREREERVTLSDEAGRIRWRLNRRGEQAV